jgi:hypothetical protein
MKAKAQQQQQITKTPEPAPSNQYIPKPEYTNGAEGFILWCEDNAWIEITPVGAVTKVWVSMSDIPKTPHPVTGKSYWGMWQKQKEILRECLRMKDGKFVYRLVVFCWMRGEGKSFIACLIKLWRFCCFLRQHIFLGANSMDQVAFVHFDTIKNIIFNSPKIRELVGLRNVKQKELCFTDDVGIIQSEIAPMSSFTGLYSNIDGYTFSDLFLMKDVKFFTQLHGSTRNIPNSMGIIDSTVSTREHILYHLYEAFIKGEDSTLYFSYRHSETGSLDDYWNPEMTEEQLNSFKSIFLFGDFERYFLNKWDAGADKLFTPEMIEATNYLGIDKTINRQPALLEYFKKRNDYESQREYLSEEKHLIDPDITVNYIERDEKRLWAIEDVMPLRDTANRYILPDMNSIDALGDIYDTNWALLAGLDRAEPDKTRTGARTIMTFLLKGMPGSRTNPFLIPDGKGIMDYIYILIHLKVIADGMLESIKNEMQIVHDLFEGIDILGGERWGAWDLDIWCDERNIKFDIWAASSDKQKSMFGELFNAVRFGRFKTPPLPVPGFRNDDLLKEEMGVFTHMDSSKPQAGKRTTTWFGSPEKYKKDGIQDDSMYALAGAMFAGKALTVTDFRERKGKINFGSFFQNSGLLGRY